MSTVTLRPSVYTDLADDSDATYLSGAFGETGQDLTTSTLPSGAVTKTITSRIRAEATIESSAMVTVTLAGFSMSVFVPSGGGGLGSYSSSPQAATLSQAELDALTYDFTTVDVIWAEMYVDVVYVAAPVANVAAVTDPYTASTIVPISWVNTLDSDGGGQVRYEWKVFDEATYPSFAGLDPDADIPFDESGVILSSLTSSSVGPLLTGDTYRAYVRVAQTVNGVPHWSAWDYDEFDLTVDTSDVDTVTAVPSPVNARIGVTVERAAASEAWELMEVQRSVDAGVTWQDVRTATYVGCTADADAFTVDDYEVPNGTNVVYRARATYFDTGLPITGAWVESSTVSWSSTGAWLKSPLDPTLNLPVVLTVMINPRRPRRRGVFDVINSASPTVVMDVLGTRRGVLDLMVFLADPSPEELLGEPILLLHAPADWDLPAMYFTPGDVDQVRGRRNDTRARWVTDFVEVDAPADTTAGR